MNPRIQDWNGRRVWLVGASSGIGAALAQALHARGARLAVSARRAAPLHALNLDGAVVLPCDATDTGQLATAHTHLLDQWGGLDLVVYLAGDYHPMRTDCFDLPVAEHVVEVNFLGAMRLASVVVGRLAPGAGLALVASVAGYRGLPQALCYGPSKAALIHFAEVLYLDLAPRGVGVWVVNPGFVDTRLTQRNDFHMPARITPEAAAQAMIDGWSRGSFEIDFPKRFTRVMKLLRVLPDRLYFPLVRRLTGA